ncbi:GNAT family N-acetyltransferase [Rubrobacter tropicus]|nr:GNAT family N-acetyltransferase [Rubrobacter tropicus]
MGVREDHAVLMRAMTSEDVPTAAAVGAEVGWPGRERRFGFFVGHPFCEAVAAEAGGEVVGIGFGTRNGAVGWIGLVCVRPAYQGSGIGAAITERVAKLMEERGCRTLILTATEMGRRVYERLGFSTETHYRGFAGPGLEPGPLPPGLRRMRPEDLPSVCDLDRRMTGEDRGHLLRALAGPGWVVEGEDGRVRGYYLPVPWGGGPLITPDPTVAKALTRLARTLVGPDETARFWITEMNGACLGLMEEMGFQAVRRLPRMARGEPLPWRPESLWGLFSLGKG